MHSNYLAPILETLAATQQALSETMAAETTAEEEQVDIGSGIDQDEPPAKSPVSETTSLEPESGGKGTEKDDDEEAGHAKGGIFFVK